MLGLLLRSPGKNNFANNRLRRVYWLANTANDPTYGNHPDEKQRFQSQAMDMSFCLKFKYTNPQQPTCKLS